MDNGLLTDRRALLGLMAAGVAAFAASEAHAETTVADNPMKLSPAWHSAETIPLWAGALPGGGAFAPSNLPRGFPDGFVRDVATPGLKLFRPRVANGKAILVIPGGGYVFISARQEGSDTALRLTEAGYTVFVLLYRLPGEGWGQKSDVPLQDAQRAMRIIASRAARYGYDPTKVAALGFSAGGHLCASLTTGFAEQVYAPTDDIDRLDARPAAAGLIYPVITLKASFAHAGSAIALLGPSRDPGLTALRSPELHVTGNTPPIFLAHGVEDTVVSMQNSILMLETMKAAKRPVEAHFFPHAEHGFGLGKPGTRAAEWPALFTGWLKDVLSA